METYQNNCRVCLEQEAILDWNEEILDQCGTTYKYCYYQCTQLEDNVPDPFSQMLCESCSCDLRKCHFLIQKALESYNILQQTYATIGQTVDVKDTKDIKEQVDDAGNFETVIFDKFKEVQTDDENDYYAPMIKVETVMEHEENLAEPCLKVKKKCKVNKLSKAKKASDDEKSTCNTIKLEKEDDNVSQELMNYPPSPPTLDKILAKREHAKKVKNRKIMCTFCPRLISIHYIKVHEATHTDRERNVACPVCDIKLYNKESLKVHIKIHAENREKRFKCEFCEKAYYARGALNVHRRIHLGQMVSCPMCPKEFPRQFDLDKHKVTAHSAALTGQTFEKKTNYLVECKECGKNIASHRWKNHSLLHSNKFQMRCTLCDKHFTSKSTCHRHVRKVHKYMDELGKVIEYYGEEIKKRSSFLMLKQTETVKPVSEQSSVL